MTFILPPLIQTVPIDLTSGDLLGYYQYQLLLLVAGQPVNLIKCILTEPCGGFALIL